MTLGATIELCPICRMASGDVRMVPAGIERNQSREVMIMFRLLNKETGLWYKTLDNKGDIVWTEYKNRATILPPEKREFWEEFEDEFEIIELAENEIMAQVGAPRLPGF